MRKRQRVFVIAKPGAAGPEPFSRDGVIPVFNLSAVALDAASHLVDTAKDGEGWVVCAGELNCSIESSMPIPAKKADV